MSEVQRNEMDTILLEAIEVPASLGVSKAERAMRRPVRIDLEVERSLASAGRSDDLKDTIDYEDLYRVVADIAGTQEHQLVEALAERIAQAVLSAFEIDRLTITVRKPKPIAGVLEHTGVRITRCRRP